MIRSVNSTGLPSAPATTTLKPYVTTGFASRYAGVSINTVKSLISRGDLRGYSTAGGHWRVSTASLLSYVDGIEEGDLVEETTENRGCVIYTRCSSAGQTESLARQKTRLLTEVSRREDIREESIVIYSEIASSFGVRPSLYRLVDDILSGQVKKVYIEYLDRWSRTSSERCLLQHIADRQGVEIIALDVEETDPNEMEYLQKELI